MNISTVRYGGKSDDRCGDRYREFFSSASHYAGAGRSIYTKTYTPNEIAQAISRPEPFYYYVTRFAGKEAVFKSLAISGEGVSLKEIEILNDAEGRPNVILHGEIAKRALQSSCAQVKISLSYDTDYAVAFAIAADGRSI